MDRRHTFVRASVAAALAMGLVACGKSPTAAPSTPTANATQAATPTGEPPSPSTGLTGTAAPAQSAAPPATPARTPPPTAASPANPNQLVTSPYGFSYPASWSLSRLLVRTATASTATATAPSGPGRLDYLSDTAVTTYNPDHTADDLGIEAAIVSLFTCPHIQSLTPVPNKGFRYTCTPATVGGVAVHEAGMVLVAPYPKGFRVLQALLPAADDAQASAILATFH